MIATRTLIKVHRIAAHFMVFVCGLRLILGGDVARRDVVLLVLAAMVCLALLYLYRRAPARFGFDPKGLAQLLVHGLAIIVVVLAKCALAGLGVEWIG